MAQHDRVIIVGAGLSGLAAACGLQHRGYPVTVLERVPQMLRVGAQIGVAANAVAALERNGLAHLVESACVPTQRLEYVSWRGRPLTHMPIAEVARELGTQTYIALRGDVQLGLYATLEAADIVQLGAECVSFSDDGDHVTARLADGREERGVALVGADGIHSIVRAGLDANKPLYAGYGGWRGVLNMDRPPVGPGVGRQTLGRGRTFGAFGLRNNVVYWWASALMAEGLGDGPSGRKADVQTMFAGAPKYVLQILEATPEDAILRNDIYDRPPVERWGVGRVTVIGDAAHAATPNTGEGGSHALFDGISLAEGLVAAGDLCETGAVEQALRRFEAEAIPRTTEVVKRSREIGRFLHLNNPVMCTVRDQLAYRATPQRIWRKRAAIYLEASRATTTNAPLSPD